MLDSARSITPDAGRPALYSRFGAARPSRWKSQALLRHVAHPHPALRAQLLLIVGKLRLRRFQCTLQQSSAFPLGNTSVPGAGTAGTEAPKHGPTHTGGPLAEAAMERRRLEGAAAAALTAALRVSFARGGHDRGVMSGSCMGLVLVYFTMAMESSGGSCGSSRAAGCDEGAVNEGDPAGAAHGGNSLSDSGSGAGDARSEQEVGLWAGGRAW